MRVLGEPSRLGLLGGEEALLLFGNFEQPPRGFAANSSTRRKRLK